MPNQIQTDFVTRSNPLSHTGTKRNTKKKINAGSTASKGDDRPRGSSGSAPSASSNARGRQKEKFVFDIPEIWRVGGVSERKQSDRGHKIEWNGRIGAAVGEFPSHET